MQWSGTHVVGWVHLADLQHVSTSKLQTINGPYQVVSKNGRWIAFERVEYRTVSRTRFEADLGQTKRWTIDSQSGDDRTTLEVDDLGVFVITQVSGAFA